MKSGNVEAEPKVLYDYSHADQLKHGIQIHVQFSTACITYRHSAHGIKIDSGFWQGNILGRFYDLRPGAVSLYRCMQDLGSANQVPCITTDTFPHQRHVYFSSRIISCQRSDGSETGHLCLQPSVPLATTLETCYPAEK